MQSTSNAQAVPVSQPSALTTPAPTRAAWLAVLSVAVGSFALVTTEFLPVGLLPSIAAELKVTEGLAGMMVTIPGIVAAFAAILVTIGVGKTDRRYVIWGLTATLIISNLMVALSDSFLVILVGRALLGIGVGGFWAIGGALGNRLVPPAYATRATSIIFAGISLGTVAGVPAGALIGELVGWRVAFHAAGAVAVLVLLTQMWLLPRLPTTQSLTFAQLPALLRVKKARLGMLATLLVFIGQFAAYTYVTPFLSQVVGLNATTISALLLTYGAAGFVGNLIGGWTVARSVRMSMIVTGLVMGLSAAALPLIGTSLLGATALIVIWGLAFGMMPISVQTWMFRAAPDAMESGGAVFVATAQISLASGALVGGVAVDHLGVSSAMLVGGVFAVAMAAVIAKWGEDDGKPSGKLHAVH
ncbi:Predicted arabinose efflux permease, MFS family [Duganella sp. CF517]|uniref:MFS transporter n=1 Tax=Duganella sp. CF517 TaxID=1881038 RepID=UPI0008C6B626|nr:MFS transporter [Duganella sp. CF517]SEN25353.1 Predicted arabinose efflux permease, MFS family [Duganella sp. CF517]